MTRYTYTNEEITETVMNEETHEETNEVIGTEVVRSVKETYPDMDILTRGLKVGRATKTIKKGLLKATQGQAESNLIQQEEEWFQSIEKIQEAEKKIREIRKELENQSIENPDKTPEELEKESELLEEQIVSLEDIIAEEKAKRDEKEKEFEFLKGYRGEETDAVRPEPATDVVISDDDLKKLIAHERDMKVRNYEDTLADLAKMNSLLFSTISAIYGTLTDTAKGKIDTDIKNVIEYSIAKFSGTQTRADRQLAVEGTALVDKLFDREVQIADIIDELKQ